MSALEEKGGGEFLVNEVLRNSDEGATSGRTETKKIVSKFNMK